MVVMVVVGGIIILVLDMLKLILPGVISLILVVISYIILYMVLEER